METNERSAYVLTIIVALVLLALSAMRLVDARHDLRKAQGEFDVYMGAK